MACKLSKPQQPSPPEEPAEIVVLLVDDDPDCRTLVRDGLSACGHPVLVIEATNGDEAMDALHARGRFAGFPRPWLVFMDIEMPGRGGLETLAAIRQSPEFDETVIVMLSGYAGDHALQQAAGARANSYVLKHVSAEQFLKTIAFTAEYWLTVHQYPQQHWPQEACRR